MSVCGSTATGTGEPCQQPVEEPGETCWREGHVAGSLGHLTTKQRRFVEEYCGQAKFNAAEAARRAGYSEKAAREIGYENLTKPHIAEAVENRLEQQAMGSDEVLQRLADMARADMGRFIRIRESGAWELDLEKAREAGLLHLVRELAYDSNGLPKIKLHDAKDALKQLGKVHGLFVERHEHTGEDGGPIRHEEVGRLSDEELLERAEQLRSRLTSLEAHHANGDG